MDRKQILTKALDCVTKDRNATHGEPEDSFKQIASVWSAMLGVEISSHQVALLMAALKIVRAQQNPAHEDNWVDLAGYAACGAECVRVPVAPSQDWETAGRIKCDYPEAATWYQTPMDTWYALYDARTTKPLHTAPTPDHYPWWSPEQQCWMWRRDNMEPRP